MCDIQKTNETNAICVSPKTSLLFHHTFEIYASGNFLFPLKLYDPLSLLFSLPISVYTALY